MITLVAMFIVVGCVDLDEVWSEIDSLIKQNTEQAKELEEQKGRFTQLEQLLGSLELLSSYANLEIGSIKGLVDALTNKLSVVSYKELDDKSGYELTMSDGSKIVLKHGTDGAAGKDGKDGADGNDGVDGVTPEISVKLHDDGLLYWTLNGEFLLDAEGNMIPAQPEDGKDGVDGKDGADGAQGTPGKDGKDGADGAQGATGAPGKDGITPLLRVNSNLYWEMSLDGGKTWQLVRDANNNPISAQGPQGIQGPAGQQGTAGTQGAQGPTGPAGEKGDPGKNGDANLTITETDTAFIIIYLGATFTIPKAPPPFNPLTLVATNNVNTAGDGFVTDLTACSGSGYFTYNNAVNQFTTITIGEKQYHLPSKEEWKSIVPDSNTWVKFTTDNASYDDVDETVTVKTDIITMKSDYRTGVEGVTYALRYKGTDMVSAWKYEYSPDPNKQTTHMKITSRSLKGQPSVTVDDIKLASFWSNNADNDVTRCLPAGGQQQVFWGSTQTLGAGTNGYFISSTKDSSYYSYLLFSAQQAQYALEPVQSFYEVKINVRLFETIN